MISVTVGSWSGSLSDLDEGEIAQQVNRRRDDRSSVCVRVRVQEPGIDVSLASPECGLAGGGMRQLTSKEQELFKLWEKHRLHTTEFRGGDVIAFLKQLRRLV